MLYFVTLIVALYRQGNRDTKSCECRHIIEDSKHICNITFHSDVLLYSAFRCFNNVP